MWADYQRPLVIDMLVERSQHVFKSIDFVSERLPIRTESLNHYQFPSEPKLLEWDDIDWERQRINFRSPKTEHHDDKDRREIPIFPELVQPLHEVHEQAKPGERRVLPWLENITSAATRKPLIKAIKLAGEEPREKLWTALRATRDTELREQHPAFVVDAWLGHDDLIAKRHYTQTLDHHFDAAVGSSAHHFCSQSDSHSVAQRSDTPQNPAEKRTVSHGQAIEWAKRDLNPRHPPCKSGALAN